MADPTRYSPSYSFSGWQTANPAKPLPAPALDNELFNIRDSLDGAIDAIKDVRRSDGKLQNSSVDLAALSDEVITQLGGGSSGGGSGFIFASAAQAEAGTSNAVVMSPLRVRQAIAALGNDSGSGPGTVAFSAVTGKPTTIGGYGITDAYTKSQTNAQIDAAVAAGGGGGGGGTETPGELLTKLKTVDGPSSGLDADLLDGYEAAFLLQADNSVKRYGAVGDGATDDTAAFEAALLASNVIYVPKGVYKLTRRLFKVGPLTIYGDGEALSKLKWQATTGGTGGGLFVEVGKNWTSSNGVDKREECYVKDLAFLTAEFVTGSKGLAVRRYNTNFAIVHGCVVTGCFFGWDFGNTFNHGWDTAIDLDGCDNTTLSRVQITGRIDPAGEPVYASSYGVKFHNAGGLASHPTVLHVSDTTIYTVKTGIYVDDMEGLIVKQCQIVAVNKGVHAHGLNTFPHAEISSCHINASKVGIHIDKMWESIISGNLIYTQMNDGTGTAVLFNNGAKYFTVVGNQFENASPNPANTLIVDNGCGRGTIDGNVFSRSNGSLAGGNGPGLAIWLVTGSEYVTVGPSNFFDPFAVATRLVDGGSGNFFPGYGARFEKTSSQSLPSGQLNIINFESAKNVVGNVTDTLADGAFVVPSTGVWSFVVVVALSGSANGGFIANIQKNALSGAAVCGTSGYLDSNTPGYVHMSTGPLSLQANDVIRVGVNPTGVSRTASASSQSYFEARRLS